MPSQTFHNLPSEKQNSLIKIAIAEFASQDYNSASISRIVRQAGIAQGSLYQYFANKKDLYLYLLELLGKTKIAFLQDNYPLEAEMGFFEYLSWVFAINLEFDIAYPALSKLGYRAFYGDVPFADPKVEQMKQAASDFIRQIVIKGIDDGDIKPNIDRDLAVFVVETLSNAISNYIPQKLRISTDKLAQEGAASFDADAAQDIFQELIKILRFGLGDRPDN